MNNEYDKIIEIIYEYKKVFKVAKIKAASKEQAVNRLKNGLPSLDFDIKQIRVTRQRKLICEGEFLKYE